MPTTKQLLRDLSEAEKAVDTARAAICKEIRDRLGDVTPYAFARAAGINRSNFYNCLNGVKWNGAIALRALDLLSTPLHDEEVELAATRVNAREEREAAEQAAEKAASKKRDGRRSAAV